MLLTDRVWLSRLTGTEFPVRSLRDELYADFDELARERAITDAGLLQQFAGYVDADLDADLSYTSVSTGRSRSYPLPHVLLHLQSPDTSPRSGHSNDSAPGL